MDRKLVPLTHEERRRLIEAPLPTFHVYSGARWKGASAIDHRHSPGAGHSLALNFMLWGVDDYNDPDF